MDIEIRPAKQSDIKEYTDLLQRTYQTVYIDESLGLTKDLFSKEIFNSADTQDYLRGNLNFNVKQKTWLAFAGTEMVGSITLTDKGEEYELKGFYVAPEYQGKGIGKKLWCLAFSHAHHGKDIVLDIYAHNINTIEIYKKWGFEVDKEKGEFYRHWQEWPDGVKAKSIYMRYKQQSSSTASES